MCGISGYFTARRQHSSDKLQRDVTRMNDALTHRGPDDSGTWVDAEHGIALGHRRLSIVDLSAHGHQPMHSAGGRYVISFNGEIYNFHALRDSLEGLGHSFTGASDTEVMLAAILEWGLDVAVQQFNGMFAFALWDRQEQLLHLVRDRLGEKPLYYGWMNDTLLFGSELKALTAHPEFKARINRNALALFMRHNYVPVPYSIYEGIFKLQPAHIVTIATTKRTPNASLRPYWSAREIAEQGASSPFSHSPAELVQDLETLLLDAVKLRMQADVPLGAFLSGGIDSSLVVALMQAQSAQPVKTFTIGFNEADYDEATHARAVAQHLGTDHTELYVTPEQAMAVVPRLPALYDEPFADSSQVPTFLVSQLARSEVTVSLSGDGGDELFAGYNRYFWGENIWRKIGWMPTGMRKSAAKLLCKASPQAWDKLFRNLMPLLPGRFNQQLPGDKLHKIAEILAVESPEEMYLGLVSHWKSPASLVPDSHEPPTVLTDKSQWASLPTFAQKMMFLDLVSYLPDDILVKLDRASMAVGLEGRVPLLDHRMVEFAARVPLEMKIKDGQGKWLLRQLLQKHVPKTLIERPKMGFGVPIDIWLRGPLRDWADSLLDEKRLREQGFFNPEPIRQKWEEHLSGARGWHYYLWDVLMFQAWLDAH